jgi:predicted kinase
MVVVVSGPPCVGKTSVAEALAREFGLPLFDFDPIAQVLARPELMASPEQLSLVGPTGIELQSVLLERQLALGVGVILEISVDRALRDRWRAVAARYSAPYFAIECMCSDRALHRRRFDARPEFRIGEWLLTWEFVERSLETYAPDEDALVVLDSVHPLGHNVAAAAAALPGPAVDARAAGGPFASR